MKTEYQTRSPAQTKKIGEILAKEILETSPGKKAFVLGLKGDLGGGKTTFLQGFARGLGVKEKILSPTFVIMKKYELRSTKKRRNLRNFRLQTSYFCHVDCYRIKKNKEILALGLKAIASDPANIVAIEWAEKIKSFLPKRTIWIKFNFIDNKKRKIIIGRMRK